MALMGRLVEACSYLGVGRVAEARCARRVVHVIEAIFSESIYEALAGRLRPGGASRERFERGETGLKSVDCRNTGEVGTRVASYIVKL